MFEKVNTDFEVEESVNVHSSFSEEVADALLDKEIKKGEIVKCLGKLKNSKTGGENSLNMVDRE